jgi:hypothetical protein
MRCTQAVIESLERLFEYTQDRITTYNNYFLQVQSLINQKAIEAQGIKNSGDPGNSITPYF